MILPPCSADPPSELPHFPEEVFEAQFEKLSNGWAEGLRQLEAAASLVREDKRENIEDMLSVSGAALCHFRSVYLQIRFIRIRDGKKRIGKSGHMIRILDEEIKTAAMLLRIMQRDSRIGFEASNHYFYTENSLKEKVINCEHLKAVLQGKFG